MLPSDYKPKVLPAPTILHTSDFLHWPFHFAQISNYHHYYHYYYYHHQTNVTDIEILKVKAKRPTPPSLSAQPYCGCDQYTTNKGYCLFRGFYSSSTTGLLIVCNIAPVATSDDRSVSGKSGHLIVLAIHQDRFWTP